MATLPEQDPGVLSPLQVIAAQGMVANTALAIPASFIAAVNSYNNQGFIQPLFNTIKNSGSLSAANVTALKNIGQGTCPALGGSPPPTYPVTTSTTNPGWINYVYDLAKTYMGNGDLSKCAQLITAIQGYIQSTNQFMDSATNSQNYLGGTFSNMDNLITGDLNESTTNTRAYGQDLKNLGNLIDLKNLSNLGTPLALVQQIVTVVGLVPSLTKAFDVAGIPTTVTVNLIDPEYSVSDSVQKLMYEAMKTITGTDLQVILTALKVTTKGINNMADLLNPVKLLPNSFQTITVHTPQGFPKIYLDASGSVNTALLKQLPPYVISSKA